MAAVPQAVSSPVLVPPVSILGDDLAPPRQLYVALLPAVLALAGLMGWTLGDEAGMVFSAAVGSAVALFTLGDWLFRHGPTRLSTLLGMSLNLGYGGGALNTWLTLPRTSTLSTQLGLDETVLAHGMAAVLISTSFLYCLGEIYEKPIFGRDFRFHFDSKTRTLIYLSTVAMLAGYATHSIGFEGPASTGRHVSIPGLFLSWLYTPLTAFAVGALLTASRGKDRIFSAISALILIGLFVLVGRRTLLYTGVEILFMLQLIGFHWRARMFRNLFLLLILVAIVIGTGLSFMLLRLASQTPLHRQVTVGQRFQIASKMIQKGGAFTTARKVSQKNVRTRTFVIAFLASILDGSFRTTPAMGADAIGLTQLAIPSVLYPDKNLWFSEEGLVDYTFNFSFGDEPNSILTAGATDFGLAGMLVYPLVIVAIGRTVLNFMARRLKVVPLMLVVLALIFTMLKTELTLTTYLESFRDSILFGFIAAIVMSLRAPKWSA